MRYCWEKECDDTACCDFCIHLKEENHEYTCKLYGDKVNPDNVCDDFDCRRNYN